MNVYYDGSYRMKDTAGNRYPGNRRCISWGIVIDDAGETTELMGCRELRSTLGAGCHETVAFIESALYLLSHGVSPNRVNFTTDDEITAYPTRRGVLKAQFLTLVTMGFYEQSVIDSIRPYLETQFHKVRGHKTCVNNLRCDYLAQVAGRAAMGDPKSKTPLSFLDWAKNGFTRYKDGGVPDTPFYVPFLSTLP